LHRKAKFWILLIFGLCLFIPPIAFFATIPLNIYTVWYILMYAGAFFIYFYMLHRHVYRRLHPQYPLVPPEGRMDIYFPTTKIPRPVYEDERRYPEFFRRKKKRGVLAKKIRKKHKS
jgi:hypothetical protein